MFADALLDSRNSRRGWATLTSFGLQATLVACLLIVPLLYTQGLPHLHLAAPVAVSYMEPVPVRVEQVAPQQTGSAIFSVVPGGEMIHVPRQIPGHIDMRPDVGTAGLPAIWETCIRCGNSAAPSFFIAGNSSSAGPHVTGPKAPPFRTSAMMEGLLIRRVEPVYPALAKIAGIQGTVVIVAVIGKDGGVENLQVASGHPLLVKSALDAVRQWRYRPYMLNNAPIEVETQITVNFILSR